MERIALAGAYRLSKYLESRIKPEIFDKYKRILVRGVTDKQIEKTENRKQFSEKNEADLNILNMLSYIGDNKLSIITVELAFLRYLYSETAELFDMIAPGSEDGVTLEIALMVSEAPGGIGKHILDIQDAYDKLAIFLEAREESEDLARIVLRCSYSLASHFTEYSIPELSLVRYVKLFMPGDEIKGCIYDDKLKEFADGINDYYHNLKDDEEIFYEPVTVAISGENESGRCTFAEYIAQTLGCPLLSVEYEYVAAQDKPRLTLIKLMKECILTGASLLVKGITSDKNGRKLVEEVRRYYDYFGSRPLFLSVCPSVKVVPYIKGRVFEYSVSELTSSARMKVWKYNFDTRRIGSEINIRELAGKMKLTVGQIARISMQIENMEKSGKVCDNKEVYKLCYLVLDDGRYDSIQRVTSGYTLDDLKISERNRQILKEVCNQVNFHKEVYEDWNMERKYAYGRCVSLLLSGPPGTGKTMAVHALSNELGLELYKVDLSQIADKYVGETEKRLEEVFSRAEKSNMILFFDEADAVMGKRSETKDSHDKYANTQIAFILQRMEKYDGIVILATNYLQNIDAAFMRRIRYVANFEIPDEETRKEIWTSAITSEVPVAKDVDFDFLAQKFEIAGGNIKNIMLNATFFAASEGKALSMKHIIRAVAYENNKDKRIMFADDLGKYAYLAFGEN